MSGEEPSETLKILLEVKKQMAELEGKVDSMQRTGTSSSFDADPEETEDSAGKLVELSEETSAFLEAAFSTTLSNAERRKRIAHIGISDCDKIRCPKLDPMLATVLPERRHKGGRLSIESAAILARCSCSPYCNFRGLGCRKIDARTSVCSRPISPLFAGKCKQSYGARKAQEGLNECQPHLEIYGGGGKCIPACSANAIWREFAKKATDRVEAVKAIKKITYSKPGEKRQSKSISAEVQTLVRKGAICLLKDHQVGFVSQLFLVPKKDGGFRPVVNLKTLNKYILEEHFKMEGFHMVRDLVRQGDWLAK